MENWSVPGAFVFILEECVKMMNWAALTGDEDRHVDSEAAIFIFIGGATC